MDELLAEFIAETRETLAPLAGEVVAWEAQPGDRSRLDTIFRFVHTVKGSCGFLDLPRLEKISHAAEGALADVRADIRTPDAALVSAVLAIIDRIGDMIEALDAGEAYPDGGDDALIAALAPSATPATAATAATTTAAAAVPRAPVRSIRLSVELLDRMMSGVSDMVLARNELSHRLRERLPDPLVDAAFERLSTCVAETRDAITRTRMQRIEHLFAPLPRMVRDLSSELGKTVTLVVEGADVELDREMIEMIRDPLTHMVRNSIDHGIETPEERVAAGKSATGLLNVSARQAGNQILIEISDDGRGIDADRLVAKAVANGLMTADAGEALPLARKLQLVFEAGLSTAKEVTSISGRGVGMDVVRANIDRIGGVIDISSQIGVGTRFTLRAPLTLTIIPALTVVVGDQQFAIPRAAIDEIIRSNSSEVRIEHLAGGVVIARIRNRRVPVADLAEVMGIERGNPSQPPTLVLLRPGGGEAYAVAVDQVCDHEELVVKPAAPGVMATGIYAGTTLPDTGRPMLLLDPSGFAQVAGIAADAQSADRRSAPRGPVEDTIPTLLFRSVDGADQAIHLSVVERIEDVPAETIRYAAGQLRLSLDGRILPLFGCAAPPPRGQLRVLRLNDGMTELAYAIGEVIDIVALFSQIAPAATAGLIAGVVLVDGRQVELIDSHWLFGLAAGFAPSIKARPLCLLGNATDPWTREVLRPLVEAAGYRVAFAGETSEADPAVIIDTEDSATVPAVSGADVIRLREAPHAETADDDTIYRYDRDRLFAALRSRSGGG